MGENFGFLPLSEKVFTQSNSKTYSHNPIQTCGAHLLGKCSELIKFWPSSGHKMTENDGFRPLSEKV